MDRIQARTALQQYVWRDRKVCRFQAAVVLGEHWKKSGRPDADFERVFHVTPVAPDDPNATMWDRWEEQILTTEGLERLPDQILEAFDALPWVTAKDVVERALPPALLEFAKGGPFPASRAELDEVPPLI